MIICDPMAQRHEHVPLKDGCYAMMSGSGGFVAGVGNLSQRYLSALDPLAAAQGA